MLNITVYVLLCSHRLQYTATQVGFVCVHLSVVDIVLYVSTVP